MRVIFRSAVAACSGSGGRGFAEHKTGDAADREILLDSLVGRHRLCTQRESQTARLSCTNALSVVADTPVIRRMVWLGSAERFQRTTR
jgi:hypothetical protein